MDEHVFDRVIREMVDSGLIRSEDAVILTRLVARIADPPLDLKEALSSQANLQLEAGYFYHRLTAQRKEEEATLEEMWNDALRLLRSAEAKRVTEAMVNAQVANQPEYAQKSRRVRMMKYLADQLGELHDAFVTRARMLEQLSNNERMNQRESLEDD